LDSRYTIKEDLTDNLMQCPNCNKTIPVHDGFVSWCHKCHWNINPSNTTKPETAFEKLYYKLSRKYTTSLFEQMKASKELKPNFTLSMWVTYLISFFIHGITLITSILSIALIILGRHYIPVVIIGIFLLLISYFLIPKPNRFDKKLSCKKECSELFSLINDIANSLNAPQIDDLVITEDFNAFYYQYGIRQKRVMGIGLPLFNILTSEEKVALISHELSHGINKDIQRDYVVNTALNALEHWYYFVIPDNIENAADPFVVLRIPINILLLGLSKIILGLYYAIQSLSWYNSQRAEYLADYYATMACGTDAMISLSNKICFSDTLDHTIRSYTFNPTKNSLLKEFNKNISSTPEREVERVKLVELHENSRLDRTHPPILYRIKFIKNHYIKDKGFVLDEERAAVLNKELSTIQSEIEKSLVNKYRINYLN